MPIQISIRLRTLAEGVQSGARVADVGTDHAYIPIYLMQTDRAKYAIAADIVDGPVQAARKNVRSHGLDERISVRQANGLASVQPGEVDTVIIAGMGGGTEAEIMRAANDVMAEVGRVILQPMNASHQVREYLDEHQFHLVREQVLLEDGRLYEMMIADRAPGGHATSERTSEATSEGTSGDPAYMRFRANEGMLRFAYEFGPTLLTKPTPLFRQFVVQTVEQWQNIIRQLAASETEATKARRAHLTAKLQIAEAWLESSTERGHHDD